MDSFDKNQAVEVINFVSTKQLTQIYTKTKQKKPTKTTNSKQKSNKQTSN